MNPTRLILLLAVLGPAGCAKGEDGGQCERARKEMVGHIREVCSSREYETSGFCSICVEADFYSIADAPECECKPLSFDSDFCSFTTGDEAKAQVRSAIDGVLEACVTPVLPREPGPGGSTHHL